MKQMHKWALAGCGAIAMSALLVSFTGDDNGKKKNKRYQVIHHQNGEVLEFDTVIPAGSNYTVENFLADKGIQSENVEIINIPSMHGDHVMNHRLHHESHGDGEAESHFVIKEMLHDVDGEGDGKDIEVRVFCETDEDGNIVGKKIVNGKEVELSEEELKEMSKLKERAHDGHHRVHMRMEGEGHHKSVQIMKEVDDNGKVTVKKIVDGKEVELTDEERKELESDSHHMRIHIDGGEMDIDHLLEDMHIDIHELEGDHEEVEVHIEKLIENIEQMEGEDGERRVIVRKHVVHGDHDGEEMIEELIEGENAEIVWESKDGNSEVKVARSGDQEDFTIVIVSEEYEGQGANAAKSIETRAGSDVSIYPNPNDGNFTLRLNQDKKAKTAIKVTDVQGKVVFEEDLGRFSGEYTKDFNLKQYGTGVYLINIQQGKDVTTEKVVVR